MKKRLLILAAALLAGCASTAPSQHYRAAGQTGPAWRIAGTFNEATGALAVTVDGEAALTGSVSLLSYSGEFSGPYRGRTLAASCHPEGVFDPREVCLVFVDAERAATLTF